MLLTFLIIIVTFATVLFFVSFKMSDNQFDSLCICTTICFIVAVVVWGMAGCNRAEYEHNEHMEMLTNSAHAKP